MDRHSAGDTAMARMKKPIPKPEGDIGPIIEKTLIRLGHAQNVVKLTDVCRLIKERTGKTISRQRLAAILKANSVEDGTIEMIAKGVGVSPAELLMEE
jgi:hypothetical protein